MLPSGWLDKHQISVTCPRFWTGVIVLTALSLSPKDEERISGEADDYIPKISITPKDLVERVNALLASRAKAK